jgi:cytoskeletal protein CcmA (bactofilin family)
MATPETRAAIGRSIIINGDVTSGEDLTIDGCVTGTIEVGGHNLTVGAGASITAELAGRTITISGTVNGNVVASDAIEVRETALVTGDLRAPRISVHDGAGISGRIEIGQGASAAAPRPLAIAV